MGHNRTASREELAFKANCSNQAALLHSSFLKQVLSSIARAHTTLHPSYLGGVFSGGIAGSELRAILPYCYCLKPVRLEDTCQCCI